MLIREKMHTGGGCWVHYLMRENDDKSPVLSYNDECMLYIMIDGRPAYAKEFLDDADAYYEAECNGDYTLLWESYGDNAFHLDRDALAKVGFSEEEINEVQEWLDKSREDNYDWTYTGWKSYQGNKEEDEMKTEVLTPDYGVVVDLIQSNLDSVVEAREALEESDMTEYHKNIVRTLLIDKANELNDTIYQIRKGLHESAD